MSQTFGKKSYQQALSRLGKTSFIDRCTSQTIYLAAAFMAIGCIVSLYLWLFIYEVPIERPYAGLFSSQQSERSGWAPFWVAPLAAMLLGFIISQLVGRKAKSLSTIKVGLLSLAMILVTSGLTSLIKNIGFVLIFVPGSGVKHVLAVLPAMISFNMVEGILDLGFDAPELVLLAAFSAAGYAVMVRLARLSVD